MNLLILTKQEFNCPNCRTKTSYININEKYIKYIKNDEICSICLDFIILDNKIVQTKCKHLYHSKCINLFIKININNENTNINDNYINNMYNIFTFFILIFTSLLFLGIFLFIITKYIIKY